MSDADISAAIQRHVGPPQATSPLARAGIAEQARWREREREREQAAPYWIAGIVVAVIICAILLRKLVKLRPLRVIPQTVRSASIMKDQLISDCSDKDADLYALAEEEMISGQIDKGTWARALVKAGGNEEKRRADYIILRVKKMRLAHP
jgi:hypothetical protein